MKAKLSVVASLFAISLGSLAEAKTIIRPLNLKSPVPSAAPVTPPELASIDPAELSGEWFGTYSYVMDKETESVEFSVRLKCKSGLCEGTSEEKNTFEDKSKSDVLGAEWLGSAHGKLILLKKTYDGKAGYAHSVRYEGRYSGGATAVIEGKWTLDDASGPFQMTKK